MMHRHKAFPLSIVTAGRHLLLIGGGDLGASRLSTAVQFDWAKITFVAPDPTPLTKVWAQADDRVTLHEREMEEQDVEGVDLVIESTMDEELGAKLAGWCRPRGILLNAMDKLPYCDIYYPALIMRGPLLVTIASSGETPALASLLRKLIEQRIGPGWCNAALLMSAKRQALPQNAARMKLMKSIAGSEEFQGYMAENNIEKMREFIEDAARSLSN